MNASPRRRAPVVGRGRRALGATAASLVLVVSLVACGSSTISPGASGPAGSTAAPTAIAAPASPAPTAAPVAYADTLRVGGVPYGQFGPEMRQLREASNGLDYFWMPASVITLGGVIYSRLYRYNGHYDAVPDLADGPCLPQADPNIIRCRLVATTFHDGSSFTADDVAYTYGLFQRDTVYYAGITGALREARVVDPRTVDFVLGSVDPLFLTETLPVVPILSRRAVEAAWAEFVASTQAVTAAELEDLVGVILKETSADPPVCTTRLDDVDALLRTIGVTAFHEDFAGSSGAFDACAYLGWASGYLAQAATVKKLDGLDAIAASLQLLRTDWEPVGTGPYRFVADDASGVHLEAFAGYHGGVAATRYLDFVPTKEDGSDLLAGTVDILQFPMNLGTDYAVQAAAHGVQIATPAEPGYYSLDMNVREGRPFADLALRRALQLCIDLPRDVDAATGGTGVPIYGPVLPGSWADDPALPRVARDVAAGRRLIEGAGWTPGADGVYAREGTRLAADILVRELDLARQKMADLIAEQAHDCGMDLRSRPTKWDDLLASVFVYPNHAPGSDQPFDLYLGLVGTGGSDPAGLLDGFATGAIPSKDQPDGSNLGGFSDPALDRLLAAAKATYDQGQRAGLYRAAQEELAAQVPSIFLWSNNTKDLMRDAVATTAGPLDLTAPVWQWQPERLVVAALP